MQRRSLLKIGVASAVLLTVAGAGMALIQPGLKQGHLTPAAVDVFRAVARAILDGSLPIEGSEREATLREHLKRLDVAVAAFPSATQGELSQLLALLVSAPGRTLLAGLRVAWHEASVAELQRSLQDMRLSSMALRQQTYHALRDLTNAAFYADPSVWPLLDYPGPEPV